MQINKKKIFELNGEPIFQAMETPLSPFEIFKKLSFHINDIFIFESLDGPRELVESSIIGFNPKFKLKCNSNTLFIYKKDKEIIKTSVRDPLDTIKTFFPTINSRDHRYVGGLVGYFCYEAIKYWEKVDVKKEASFPLLEFGFYDDGIIYDHNKNRFEYFYYGKSRLKKIMSILDLPNREQQSQKLRYSNLRRSIDQKAFENKVKKVKRHLSNGDIFQAVISKKIKFTFNGNPLSLYEELRKINPSPYMFFFKSNSRILLGSSPEMLLRITNDEVETYPIAGSRPVSSDSRVTESYKIDMLRDKKEVAEHTMLVDLARNDLGKVCRFGTVVTPQLMTVKQFSHVQHMVSHVMGILDSKYDSFDAFRSVFPAGTISGAPKIRAMEIINKLESESRGPYAGAIGYFSFNQSCDFAITIRSIFINKNNGYTQSGAGIVIDSDPQKEYQETEDKSNAILSLLKTFERVR